MTISHRIRLYGLGLMAMLAGCRSPQPALAPVLPAPPMAVLEALSDIKQTFAPDGRVAHFKTELVAQGKQWILRGETNLPNAKTALLQKLSGIDFAITDSLQLLPNASVGEKTWAIANNAVINLRYQPEHAGEMATQVLLGQVVRVLKAQDYWYWVQTPDGYLAWVEAGALHRITPEAQKAYELTPKVIYLRPYGFALAQPNTESEPVSDLTFGNVLGFEGEEAGYVRVTYPDGRKGYVHNTEVTNYATWQAETRATTTSLVASAKRLMGVPYLWGGTSTKGVDCSGFTKTIYEMNGLMLQRDASQQAREGVLVDDKGDFSKLQAGDLLFFGKKATSNSRERVIHVGMWIGGGRFIHSSSRVQINSMNPENSDFSAYERGRYLYSRRMLGHVPAMRLTMPIAEQ